MGFNGFVVSDWASIAEMIAHGYAADGANAAKKAAIAGGSDMDGIACDRIGFFSKKEW
jgi:beta-glucosidase